MSLGVNPAAEPSSAQCSGPRQAASHHCAEADRLASAAQATTEELHAARRQLAELVDSLEGDLRMGDRRALNDAKEAVLAAYRNEHEHAHDGGQLMLAAATWMNDVSRLNRTARRAGPAAALLRRRQLELAALTDRLELCADAARIAADSARQACYVARNELAACEEAHDARLAPASALAVTRARNVAEAPTLATDAPILALLRGDRRLSHAVVSRLAEEIGHDAGRLQLLVLDLREAIIASGQRACAFDFPPRHPFWSQFSRAEARALAAALARLNRQFDGVDGWANATVATPRELSMAVSLAGRDPRSVRRQPAPSEIETLWQGTTVGATEHLLASAPDMRLEQMIALLGPRADALAELWDNWGRLRPLLLGNAS